MLSTELIQRVKEDIDFKEQNINTLITEVIVIDDNKTLYDQGISKIENSILDGIIHVNEGFALVTDAYQGRIDSGCRSDLFWRQVGFQTGPEEDEITLECTRLNSDSYEPIGVGSESFAVKYIGVTGITTFYPISSNYSNELVGIASFVDQPFFGFERENRYAMKFYSQPYDKDIGNTLVGEFIGTCGLGTTTLTVMQPVGSGITFGVGQVVRSVGNLAIFPNTAKIVGVGTTQVDLRVVPNVGFGSTNSQATVNILTMSTICGASASARESLQFRVLDDPDQFSSDSRKRYDIPFNQDPFTKETISVAFRESDRSQLGIGISMFISKDGAPSATSTWDQYKKMVPEKVGKIKIDEYAPEPSVGGGKENYRVGFGHEPVDVLGNAASEGDTRIVDSLTPFPPLYDTVPSCSTAIDNSLSDAITEAAARKNEFDSSSGKYNIYEKGVKSLRDQRNSLQLGIHGIRKMLGTLNNEFDDLKDLEKLIGIATITEVID